MMQKQIRRSLLFCLMILLVMTHWGCRTEVAQEVKFGTEKGLVAKEAMVVTAHPEASRVGREILEQGGNAVDAAIAVQYALAVVYPIAGNLGGGGFMVVRMEDGTKATLDFREKAPGTAGRDMYLDSLGEVIPNLSTAGHLAAGVPGTVGGMQAAHDSLGSLPLATLIQPACDLAMKGFAITAHQAANLNAFRDRFLPFNDSTCAYLKSEGEWTVGDLLIQKELGHTLELIRDNGASGFYEGTTAQAIVEEMATGNGIMTLEDLAAYEAKWREPIIGEYKELKIITMGPPSSGGICLMQMLNMVESHPIAKHGWQHPEAIHVMVEAERRAYADRAAHLADQDFWPVPVAGLLAESYTDERMNTFNPAQATASDAVSSGAPAPKESDQTTHFSIMDGKGNTVSITTTLNAAYGSKVVVNNAGFFLNNEMDDFSSKPGHPNLYGLVGAEANAIEPGKRMLSSMTPTIVERDGKVWMAVGSPGGSTIITSVFQTILNVYEHGMTMQEAVAAKRFHHQWLPDAIKYEEGGLDATDISILESKGHATELREAIGRVDAILVLPDGSREAGADPRGDDTADGF